MTISKPSKYRFVPEPFMRVMDTALIWIGAYVATEMRFDVSLEEVDSIHVALLYLCSGTALFIFPNFDLYSSWRGRLIKSMLPRILMSWTSVLIIALIMSFLLRRSMNISRGWVAIWYIVTLFMLVSYRVVVYRLLRELRRRGHNIKNVIIIGYGSIGKEMYKRSLQYEWYGYCVKAIYSSDHDIKDNHALPAERILNIQCIDNYIQRNNIDEVWITLPLNAVSELSIIQYTLRNALVDVRLMPDVVNVQILSSKAITFLGMPAFDLNSPLPDDLWNIAKNTFDLAFAFFAILILSPVFLVIAVCIKISMPGPIFFKQKRLGLNGREFFLFKFRSMKLHETGPTVKQATHNDPRVTRFGKFLRRNSLDELPQFLNVLRGEMSIVGPRPHAVEHNVFYEEKLATYMLRHRVKPGITGWAQIHGFRGETDTYEKMEKRVQYDIEYIRQWSFLMDMKILIWTAFKGWQGNNAY